MMPDTWDIAILGKGAAAFAAAIKASEKSSGKARIVMVGSGPIGGTCVNVGCVPSKYLLEASHRLYYTAREVFPGVGAVNPSLDFPKLMEGVHNLVGNMRREKYEKVLRYYPNVEVLDGKAKFESPTAIKVVGTAHEKTIYAKNFIVATGSRPTAPPIEGLEQTGYITSDSVWNLEYKPETLAVIGGGAIGLELGQAFRHLGSEVTVLEAMPRIVPPAEPEVSETLQGVLEDEGVKFQLKVRIARVYKKDGKKALEVVTAQGKRELVVDEILVATGRAPNTDMLDLDKAGVRTDERGFIVVDKGMRTSNPNIYSAGDCLSKRLMLETLAAREGVVAATNILGGSEEVDYSTTPWAVFTNPQVASVGYTEDEVMAKMNACACRIVDLDRVAKAGIMGSERGLIKLVLDPYTYKVIGVHALTPNATEYIVEGALAIKYGLTYSDLINTTHVFPTLAEGVKLAAQSFIRPVDRMSCCVE
ncbi:mercury(II) reductase [Candidatus Marsarchaeota G2 archaeon ECH_B_2]|uniref:Mercuric reductase n=3 Tax=Candidatus Marsarchaeota group 2 TaxID=2203771 RepID=A0A2R6B478_9ARCH|nr:MAG: mercury(II) reductase [Candidatus Marsarchaeota G2 archaeon ECH_B_2]PSN97875.1 MAG: mercury(II) reductase [Candidatus Marsarchaeota G2 archaeon ECH_B_3]PSN99315.1 MAG: mercury(II) reductase [Candidatus Marsarchaeota G2 archaeon ECH_B_1]